MILSANSIRKLADVGMISPFEGEKKLQNGMSYGLSVASYDFRSGTDILIQPLGEYQLGVTLERFSLPKNIAGQILDKSSWARKGISLFNTWIDPGFSGYITIEIVNHNTTDWVSIVKGDPLGQIIFFYVDEDTDGYDGKYQYQKDQPVQSVYERGAFGERIIRSDYGYPTNLEMRRKEYAGDFWHERD